VAIGGGGAAELRDLLEDQAQERIGNIASEVGITSVTGENDLYIFPDEAAFRRLRLDNSRSLVDGELIRDWSLDGTWTAIWLYDEDFNLESLSKYPAIARIMRLAYAVLRRRKRFGTPMIDRGLTWYEWQELYVSKLRVPLSITFGFVATHNHFVFDDGGKVFLQTAPVIKLPADTTEDRHLELLGLLNSSTACFWLKQVCFPKGGNSVGQDGARVRPEMWDVYFEFDSTKVKQFPVSAEKPLAFARSIHSEANARQAILPAKLCAVGIPTRCALDAARDKAAAHLARMIALQEELDWRCYRLYGILDEDFTVAPEQVPPLHLGERAFEIRMAREHRETTWFDRHRSTPITELPAHWPEAYRKVVCHRLEVMKSNHDIGLIEQPEYKRRWNLLTWEEMEQAALKNWLLDRMEANAIWHEHAPVSCAKLRDALARDADWTLVAGIYNGGPIDNLDELIVRLAVMESVPFLPVLRYTESGLRKRTEWEQVWDLQRKEDAGETVEIPVPPKYRTHDFRKSDYWRLRGGLDVPKERFILYAAFERDADPSPVLGWAGWNHLEQARALASYYQRMRQDEGWEPERLKPILAGLLDLKPWLVQWHNEVDPEMGVRMGEYFVQFAEGQCQELGFSPEDVCAWQPATVSGRRGRRRRSQ